jgi:hypothetical protein
MQGEFEGSSVAAGKYGGPEPVSKLNGFAED